MKTIAMLLFLCCCLPSTYAATPLPAPPTDGWCYDALLTTGYTGVRSCPTPPPTSCPAGRMTHGRITYPNVPGGGSRNNADLTEFANIWGSAKASDPAFPFPGASGAVPAIGGWIANGYIAAKFHAGSNPRDYVTLRYSTYYSGPLLTMAVSTRCGDFAPVNPNCLTSNVGTGNQFKKIVIAPYTNGCPVTPGIDYYVNLKVQNGTVPSFPISTNNIVGQQP